MLRLRRRVPHVEDSLGRLLTLAWLAGYAVAVARFGRWLRRGSVRRALDVVLGAVLVGLGLRVGSEVLTA